MGGLEVFLWLLALLGWVVFQIVQRIRKPRRPLGTIEDSAERTPQPQPQPLPRPAPVHKAPSREREAPLDVEWGRAPPVPASIPIPLPTVPPLPLPRRAETHVRSADRDPAEFAVARELARRQAEARRALPRPAARRHPHRPRLRTSADLRDAVVIATVLGPCRAFEPYRSPDQQA